MVDPQIQTRHPTELWTPFWLGFQPETEDRDLRQAAHRLIRTILDPRLENYFFAILVFVVAGAIFAALWYWNAAPLENKWIRLMLYLMLSAALAAVLSTWLRMWLYRSRLADLMSHLARHPVVDFCPEPKEKTAGGIAACLASHSPRVFELRLEARKAQAMLATFRAKNSESADAAGAGLMAETATLEHLLNEIKDIDNLTDALNLERALYRAAGAAMFFLAQRHPPDRSLQDQRAQPDDRIEDLQCFVASQLRRTVTELVRQFRYLTMSLVGGFLFLIAAIYCYVFEPKSPIQTLATILAVSAIIMDFYVYVLLDRDPTISRILGTQPGKLEWNFNSVKRFVLWVLVPLLGLISTQIPSVTLWLSRFLGPFMTAGN